MLNIIFRDCTACDSHYQKTLHDFSYSEPDISYYDHVWTDFQVEWTNKFVRN